MERIGKKVEAVIDVPEIANPKEEIKVLNRCNLVIQVLTDNFYLSGVGNWCQGHRIVHGAHFHAQ